MTPITWLEILGWVFLGVVAVVLIFLLAAVVAGIIDVIRGRGRE